MDGPTSNRRPSVAAVMATDPLQRFLNLTHTTRLLGTQGAGAFPTEGNMRMSRPNYNRAQDSWS